MRQILVAQSGIHAVIFYGAPGSLAEPLARRLAAGWICQRPDAVTGEACEECPVCRARAKSRAVDLVEYRPGGPSAWIVQKAIVPTKRDDLEDDSADQTPLVEFFRTPPLMSPNKVALFSQADRLYGSASNALLKTLEEPSPRAKVVMWTHEPSKVLATVRSRCLNVPCELSTERPESSDPLAVLVRSQHELGELEPFRSAYEPLVALLESWPGSPRGAALRLADQFRDRATAIAKARDSNARSGNAEALRAAAAWSAVRAPSFTRLIVDAHAHVLANGNPVTLTDRLFAASLG